MCAFSAQRVTKRLTTLTVFFTALSGAFQAGAAQCVNATPGARWTVTGIVAAGAAPTLYCPSNPAWGQAAPYNLTRSNLADGNPSSFGTVQFTRNGGHLFVGITVGADNDLSDFDQVILVFDRNNNDTFEVGDFYIKVTVDTIDIVAPRTSPSGRDSCKFGTRVEYYQYDGSGFIKQGAPGTIDAKSSYDYEQTHDMEDKLWNVEIDIPMATFGIQTVDPFFAMGVYVFAAADHAGSPTGAVLAWPPGLEQNRTLQEENTLNTPTIVAASLGNMKFDVCYDVNFAVTHAMTSNSTTEVNKTGPTQFTAYYFFDGPGSEVDMTHKDSGAVRIRVFRMTASNPYEQLWTATQNDMPVGDNMPHHVLFNMEIPGGTEATNFCSDVLLDGWKLNDDRSQTSDSQHVNVIFLTTSQVTKDIDLPVDGIPGLAAGASTSLLLNITTSNDPESKKLSSGASGRRSGAAALLAGMAFVGIAALVRRRRSLALTMLTVGGVVTVLGCPRPGPSPIGTDRWTVANARALGLTPVPGEPDWYRMPARKGELKRARFEFTGRPLPYKTVTDSLRMAVDSNGRPRTIRIPARAGQVVTIFGLGKVDVDGPDGRLAPTDANGLVRKDVRPSLTTAFVAGPTYPLGRPRYVPQENVGTLVASADGFKTSFLIGTNASFVVPQGAEGISLAINGSAADYRSAVGEYLIKWIVTPPPAVPTVTSYAFNTPIDQPRFVLGWMVLSSVNIATYYETEVRDPRTGAIHKGRAQLGEAHIGVYESH